MVVRPVFGSLLILFVAPVLAMAGPGCGTNYGADKPMFTTPENNDMVASCRTNGVCILTAGTRDQTGRISEILFVGVDKKTRKWSISFLSSDHQFEVSKGVSVQIGKGNPILIPSRLLSAQHDPQMIRFENKLARLLRDSLLRGNESTWTYTSKQGVLVVATLSHKGLVDAIAWLNCKADTEQPSAQCH